MAANSIAYASLFQSAMDEQMEQELVSRDMEAEASQVKYNGGNELKILKIAVTGLGDYSRSGGYPTSGAVTTEWETFTFDKDRAQRFNIDKQDDDESFVGVASKTMGVFQKTEVIPEVDAYRFSKIYTLANAAGQVEAYTPAEATILKQLTTNISAIQDVIGENEPLRIYISYGANNILNNCDGIEKSIDLMDFTAGGITTKVRSIDGVPILRVPSARFKTAYTFSSTDGFEATALAAGINWIITAKRSVIGVVKQEAVKTVNPEVNQTYDGWSLFYRKYHTLFIPDNKLEGVFVSYTAIAAPAMTATVAASATTAGSTKFTATVVTVGNTLGYILGAASPGVKYNDLIDSFTGSVEPYTSAADIPATADQYLTMCEVDTLGRIVLAKEVVLEAADIKSA